MNPIWKKENETDEVATIPAGCKLSEAEMSLLMRLAGRLSLYELRAKGFKDEESAIIHRWFYAMRGGEK